MNARTRTRNPSPRPLSTAVIIAGLLLAVSVGCSPESTQPTGQPSASATVPQSAPATPSATAPQAAPATPLPTATSEALIPAGWVTDASQQPCEYAISYPSEMQGAAEGDYSRTIAFKVDNPEEAARNFVYVSVIVPDFQSMEEGSVYNYDPAEADILLNMQVGESKPARDVANLAQWFTYQRKPDTPIGDHVAQTYENVQPWEFPGGTKEIRYYLSLNGCTYLIGGYLDTTGSNQPGAITEELFDQIIATIRLIP